MSPPAQLAYLFLYSVGQTGQSWRSRNNFVGTHSDGFRNKSALVRKGNSQQLECLLTERDKQSNLQRSFVKTLRPEADSIDRSKALLQGMSDLQRMNLLQNKELCQTKFPGIIKYQHIYNDYHLPTANPGYSRNQLGKHYFKWSSNPFYTLHISINHYQRSHSSDPWFLYVLFCQHLLDLALDGHQLFL